MHRGISGGQKKRVTTGVLQPPQEFCFVDSSAVSIFWAEKVPPGFLVSLEPS